MSFLHRQRLRLLKQVAYGSSGGDGAPGVVAPARWQFDVRTAVALSVVFVLVTAVSVWVVVGRQADSVVARESGRSQAEKLVGGASGGVDWGGQGDGGGQGDEGGLTGEGGLAGEGGQGATPAEDGGSAAGAAGAAGAPGGQDDGQSFAGGSPVPGSRVAGLGGARGGARGARPAPRVFVHVAGAVAKPGVVSVVAGARVFEAIEQAGGASAQAQVSAINLAAPVADGAYIYVPTAQESEALRAGGLVGFPGGSGVGATQPGQIEPGAGATQLGQLQPGFVQNGQAASGARAGCVDINSADVATLQNLPGVGPALAQRIVQHRDQNGFFSRVEDLDAVSGIGQKLIHRIQDSVCQ